MMTTLDWQDHGACRQPGIDPELFFPNRGELTKIRAAKAICADCPVWAQCRIDGLDGGAYRFGIWGGLTDTDRKQLRRHAGARNPTEGASST